MEPGQFKEHDNHSQVEFLSVSHDHVECESCLLHKMSRLNNLGQEVLFTSEYQE